jgi:septum formation protein
VSEDLILASASPRRAHILTALGVRFRVKPADVDETIPPEEGALAAVERLARAKALAVSRGEALPVVGADTVVVADGLILGKPRSREEAAGMLRRLSGREHEVMTGLCVARGESARSAVERTVVGFAFMSEAEIDWYVGTGEPMDKAGGYHIDGRGALFVARVQGSPSNVAGFPVRLFRQLAADAGLLLTGPRA